MFEEDEEDEVARGLSLISSLIFVTKERNSIFFALEDEKLLVEPL